MASNRDSCASRPQSCPGESGSVGRGELGLRWDPLQEMIAATTPLFTAMLAFSLAGEREDLARSLCLVCVAVGAIIATEGEPMWNLLGFMLGMGATVTRGLKSVLQHILLSNEEEKLDSMNLLRYMSLFAVALLIPGVLILEGPMLFIDIVLDQYDAGNMVFIMWLVLNITSAFLLNLFQFLVTKCVGPTALQVLGNFKGVLCAFLSILIFRNPVTVQSVGGYMLTTVGVFLYSYLKNSARMLQLRKKLDVASPVKPNPHGYGGQSDGSDKPLISSNI